MTLRVSPGFRRRRGRGKLKVDKMIRPANFYLKTTLYQKKISLPSVSDVESTQKKDEQPRDREGKFLLYWMTTTSTSTTFTATTTVSSLACTPSGFTISNCSG